MNTGTDASFTHMARDGLIQRSALPAIISCAARVGWPLLFVHEKVTDHTSSARHLLATATVTVTVTRNH